MALVVILEGVGAGQGLLARSCSPSRRLLQVDSCLLCAVLLGLGRSDEMSPGSSLSRGRGRDVRTSQLTVTAAESGKCCAHSQNIRC